MARISPTASGAVPDEQLVAATLAGDTNAFQQIVERHHRVVYGIARRKVGPNDADDVVQETFLRAFRRLHDFRGDSLLRSWLLTIAHNAATDTATRKLPEPVDVYDETRVLRSNTDGPAATLEHSELHQQLVKQLRELRPEHRVALVLREMEGLAYQEIAAATASPIGSVKGRLFRARAQLIDLMRASAYDWELPS